MAVDESTYEEFAKMHPSEFWWRRSWVKRSSRATIDVVLTVLPHQLSHKDGSAEGEC